MIRVPHRGQASGHTRSGSKLGFKSLSLPAPASGYDMLLLMLMPLRRNSSKAGADREVPGLTLANTNRVRREIA